jgi:hypothetical protein
MQKIWRLTEFIPGVTSIDTLREIVEFLNKHKLEPNEVKVIPNYVHDTGYDHDDNKFGVTVLYFSDKELPRY